MITVGLETHRDGDHLIVLDTNPLRIYFEKVLTQFHDWRIVPYSLWNKFLIWSDSKDKELYRIPITNSCDISIKLWGADSHMCGKENCPLTEGEADDA